MDNLKLFVRGEIRSLAAYEAESDESRLKMDANENPYDLPAEVTSSGCPIECEVPEPRREIWLMLGK